jgi:hypothetical protein
MSTPERAPLLPVRVDEDRTPTPGISACKPFCWLGKPFRRLGTSQNVTVACAFYAFPVNPTH